MRRCIKCPSKIPILRRNTPALRLSVRAAQMAKRARSADKADRPSHSNRTGQPSCAESKPPTQERAL